MPPEIPAPEEGDPERTSPEERWPRGRLWPRGLWPRGPWPRWTAPALGGAVVRAWEVTKAQLNPTEQQRLFGLTIAIGGVCGLVAVAFHQSIRWIEQLTVERALAVPGDLWIPSLLLVPTLGALMAGVLLRYLPGARGSGVPQVKVAYAISAARLRVRDSIGKFVIGALQIGTGSSLGREGPTVQICSGVAKGMGRLAGVSVNNLKLLLPVGSAAGIAAAFNAPIAAVTFTIEEVVGTLDQTLLSGVIVAAALAAVVEQSVLGDSPVFAIPKGYGLEDARSLGIYALLGVAAALASVAFTELLLGLRRRFRDAKALPMWFRPAVGGAATGALAVGVLLLTGVGGMTGGGYDVLVGALSGQYTVDVLLLLGACKLAATVLSYSSGGAGGIFAPSLFIGAMLGGAFGALDARLFGHGHAEFGSFALVGMGAVFAGSIRAPITSVLIILEMTAGYGLTLPLMIANTIAYGLARRLRPVPIYEALLEQDGIRLHRAHERGAAEAGERGAAEPAERIDRWTLDRLGIGVGETPPAMFAPAEGAAKLLAALEAAGRQEVFPVVDAERRLVGLIALEDLLALSAEPDLGGLVCAADVMRPPAAVQRTDPVNRALELMMARGIRELPVVDGDRRVIGLVGEVAIAHEYVRARVVSHAGRSASGVHVIQREPG